MSVSVRCLDAAPTKSYERGPRRCHGTIPSPGNWTMKSIVAEWRVSFMAFHFLRVWVPFPYTFFDFHRRIPGDGFSTKRFVACPLMSLLSTRPTPMGGAVLGT